MQRILILAPHTDDGEISCGGSIVRFLEEGKDVFYIAFSGAEASVREGLPKDILRKEVIKATAILGIKPENLIVLKYQVRKFTYSRQEILEDIIRFRDEINPDLVFTPILDDLHQDHKVIAEEGLRAFKQISIVGYEQPWNNITFNTRFFIPLEKQHIDKKVEALMAYESQRYRTYLNEEYVRSLAKVRGTQIGIEFAESFDLMRWIYNS